MRGACRAQVRKMLNETMIRCFLTLAENLSFTKTAQEMYMTQQAVSKYIARLEETLGFRLFLRTRHYVKLTRAGEMYRDLFSKYQDEFDRVSEAVTAYYRDLQKQIKLGYLEMLDISSSIADALKQARQKDSELRFSGVKLPQHELLEQFADRELDMIITYREFAPKEAGVKSHRILNTPLVLLVSPEDPVNVEGATVADFRSHPFIKTAAGREPVAETRERALRQCRELGFTPEKIVVAPNLESAYMNAELGQGVFVSTMLSRVSLHSSLTCFPIGKEEELRCFWHENTENRTVARFADMLQKAFQARENQETTDTAERVNSFA